MGVLIRMLFTGLLRRGLPLLAGITLADLWDKIFQGKQLPGNIPSPEPVYKGQQNRFQKIIILVVISSLALTLITFILRKMRIKLPF